MEEIARQAEVSIGTLYNHFPHPDALLDAIFPHRVALDQIAVRSLEEPDPWTGFVGFVEGLFALQSEDRGLNEALASRYPDAEALNKACERGFMHVDRIIDRAHQSGQLRKTSNLRTWRP